MASPGPRGTASPSTATGASGEPPWRGGQRWPASRARDDSGAIGLWLLGLCLLLLALGGVSLDLWRAFSERRALAGAVDAAAIAGAAGIDLAALHGEGTLRLDPARARALASSTLAADSGAPTLASAEITSTAEAVTVRASARVELTLLRVLAGDQPLVIAVTATSGPRLGAP